ncbi:MAG: zinc ABC transporter substrate-binding protein [Phycisphaerae bacterium]|nr:zinc ABC transporter substrate-binding protein [Phycisphaerae bacterium]
MEPPSAPNPEGRVGGAAPSSAVGPADEVLTVGELDRRLKRLLESSTGDVRLLSEADLILYNGLNLEGKMGDLFVRMARSRPTAAVTERIDEKLLREPPEFAGHFDPHVWFDVEMWSGAVERIRDALIELDPDGRSEYERRTKDYLEELYELNEWISEQIAAIPAESRVLITAHDAFGYFGRAYDIEVRGLQGISTESEPSLKDVNDLVDLLVSRRIKAVFVESSVPRKSIEALIEGCRARGHEVRVGGELFSDAMGRAGTPEGTYVGMVRHNVETIVNALK